MQTQVRSVSTRHLFLALLTIMTVWVFLQVEARLLLGADAGWTARIVPFGWLLHVHAAGGVVALLCGAVQFLPTARRRRTHRILGRAYVAAVAVAAPLAIWIAARHAEPSEGLASAAQGAIWLWTTAAAVLAIRCGDVQQHRSWMARSYALTLTFVASRFLTEVLHLQLPAQAGGATALVWLLSLLALLVADSMMALASGAQSPGQRLRGADA